MATKVIKRTPDLGLTVRLQPLAETPAPDACPPAAASCVPAPGNAFWWDGEVGTYSASIVVGLLEDNVPVGPWGWRARLDGELCDCTVEWASTFEPADNDSNPAPTVVACGRYAQVTPVIAAGATTGTQVAAGVLTLTAKLTRAEGKTYQAEPIYLVLTGAGSSSPAPDPCTPCEAGQMELWTPVGDSIYEERPGSEGYIDFAVGEIESLQAEGALCFAARVDGRYLANAEVLRVEFSPDGDGSVWQVSKSAVVRIVIADDDEVPVAGSAKKASEYWDASALTVRVAFARNGRTCWTPALTLRCQGAD